MKINQNHMMMIRTVNGAEWKNSFEGDSNYVTFRKRCRRPTGEQFQLEHNIPLSCLEKIKKCCEYALDRLKKND